MPDQVPISEVFSVAKDITLTTALLYILWSGSRGKWFWLHYVESIKAFYERIIKDKDERIADWQSRYAALLNKTETVATRTAEVVAKLPKQEPLP